MLYEFVGEQPNSRFGMFTDGAGDVNNDGVPDVLVGAWGASPGGLPEAGAVFVYSGADGSKLHEWAGNAPDDQLGRAVCRVGDVDGDGFDDVAAGAWGADNFGLNEIGVIYVWSGATGAVIHEIWGVDEFARFGRYMRDTGDIDKDGVNDFISGAYHAQPGGMTSAGRASVFSGATGLPIWEFDGENPGDGMGRAVSGAGDVNGDGWLDLLVGAWLTDYGDTDAGSAYVFSGFDGTLLQRIDGTNHTDRFGRSVSDCGDVDGDTVPDLIVAAYLADVGQEQDAGSVYVISGATWNTIHQFDGESAFDTFGWFVDGPGDTDGDGVGDVLVAAYQSDPGGLSRAGTCYLYSGATGVELFRFTGVEADDELGRSVSAVDDMDGDGLIDLVLGADTTNRNGFPSVGSAYVYGSNTGLDSDADSLSDFAEGARGTGVMDTDSDDDGIIDGAECLPWLTDPLLVDSDGDGIQDGTELSVVSGDPGNPGMGIDGTDPLVFIPDADPLSSTDPLNVDTDNGTLEDGDEDCNFNGAVDVNETDPTNALDDLFPLSVTNLVPAQNATVEVTNAKPGAEIYPIYSIKGPGPSYISAYDFDLQLSKPFTVLPMMIVAPDGTASQAVPIPGNAPSGKSVWWQAVERVPPDKFRLSDPLLTSIQ